MDKLKTELQQLIASVEAGASFESLMKRFGEVLANHADVLGDLSGRYRLQTTDTGLSFAFELAQNHFRMLDASEAADATISAKESDLMALIRRELAPMAAMFTGKLKVEGSMAHLARFAQIL